MGRRSRRNAARDQLVELLREGCHDRNALAERLGLSAPTITRAIRDLRQEGYTIVCQGEPGPRWCFKLISEPDVARKGES